MATANVINEFSLNVNISKSYKRQCSVAIAQIETVVEVVVVVVE